MSKLLPGYGMSNCGDLCTAAKCEDLERRIEALEQDLKLLEASFEAHTQQSIPEAHKFEPAWDVDVDFRNDRIFVAVTIDGDSRHDTAILPNHQIDVEASFNKRTNILRIDVSNKISKDFVLVEIPIPEIPEYKKPEIEAQIFADLIEDHLIVEIDVNGSRNEADVYLGDYKHEKSNLKLSGLFQSEKLYLTVADGESTATEVIDIPLPEPYEPEFLDVALHVENGGLGIEVRLDDLGAVDAVELPKFEPEFLDVTLHVENGGLGIEVRLDDLGAVDAVELPVFEPFVTVDVFESDNGRFVVKVSVNGDTDEDSFVIEIPEMNCDRLEEKLDRCCSEITDLLDSLSLQLTNAESIINQSVDEVYREITIDISGTAQSNYSCSEPLEDEDDPDSDSLPLPYISESEDVDYSGRGLAGIHENLKIINQNLDRIHEASCKSIQPMVSVDLADVVGDICGDSSLTTRDQFQSEESFYNFIVEQVAEIAGKFGSSKLLKLLKYTPGTPASFIVKTTASWAISFLIEKAFKKQSNGIRTICQVIEEKEEADVVSIVSSDKVINRATGRFLVLHFVTPANYPKRSKNSTYWPVQIPAAMPEDEYNWCEHFENLRWSRGNCFAELKFNQFSTPVSGFFKDKDAADSYFNEVLKLTTATEKNRVYHEHKDPQKNIIERVTRPYRAFIESVNIAGQGVCHIKFVPPTEPCE